MPRSPTVTKLQNRPLLRSKGHICCQGCLACVVRGSTVTQMQNRLPYEIQKAQSAARIALPAARAAQQSQMYRKPCMCTWLLCCGRDFVHQQSSSTFANVHYMLKLAYKQLRLTQEYLACNAMMQLHTVRTQTHSKGGQTYYTEAPPDATLSAQPAKNVTVDLSMQIAHLPDRPLSWLSMRRDSCRSVPITISPPAATTVSLS